MSLRITLAVRVEQMDGTQVIDLLKTTTVINPNPRDPIAEMTLAKQGLASGVAEIGQEGESLMDEATQAVERLMGGV